MIRAVITDCFGMLYPDPVAAYRHDGRTPDHIVSALQDIHDRSAVGDVSQQDYVTRAAWLLKLSEDTVLKQFFSNQGRNDEAFAYLQSLRPAVKIVLLTNAGAGMVESRFTITELDQHFDQVVLSYMLKTAKPDPAIYRWTCEQLALQPPEVIALDDNADNCEAARAVGMTAIQYRSLDQLKLQLDALLQAAPAREDGVGN